jgi:hypothetical protein
VAFSPYSIAFHTGYLLAVPLSLLLNFGVEKVFAKQAENALLLRGNFVQSKAALVVYDNAGKIGDDVSKAISTAISINSGLYAP